MAACPSPARPELTGGGISGLAVNVEYAYDGTFLCQAAHDRLADTAGASGNNDRLTFKASHRNPLLPKMQRPDHRFSTCPISAIRASIGFSGARLSSAH